MNDRDMEMELIATLMIIPHLYILSMFLVKTSTEATNKFLKKPHPQWKQSYMSKLHKSCGLQQIKKKAIIPSVSITMG